MGWETRGGHSYYYRKERQGHRVVSTTTGAGRLQRSSPSWMRLTASGASRNALRRKSRCTIRKSRG